ncbi:MAG: hypothetical protein ACK5OX_07000 [Desertimonas sp.]
MADWWDRVDVSSWESFSDEVQGSHEVQWLQHEGVRWLHKYTTTPTNGVEQGEDWAEVVSTRVAVDLGVPCAQTALALRHGRRGSISRSVRPSDYDLYDGALELQWAAAPGYVAHAEGAPAVDPARPGIRRPGHTIANLRAVLSGCAAPLGFEGPDGFNGYDVFVGYLLLDAMIANQDRHEQNWAILRPRLESLGTPTLSPSFDHASSLGFNLHDPLRQRILEDGRLEVWARKGVANRFEHVKGAPLTLVDHAAAALSVCSPPVVAWWQGRVVGLDMAGTFGALAAHSVDSMSHPAVRFAIELLTLNHERLKDAIARYS